jgi:hypothetical protein
MGVMRNAYRILVGKPDMQRSFGRPKCTWEDNIGMDLREIWWEVMPFVHLTHDRDHWQTTHFNTVMNL